MNARIVVENHTGRPIRFAGCGSVFQLLLHGQHYAQSPVRPACAIPMSVPVGTSSYRVTILARYSACSPTAQPPDPACGPHDSIPALPPGRYEVSTAAAAGALPVPPDRSITITP